MEDQGATSTEIWQAEIGRAVREVAFDELAALISAGVISTNDKIRRGNLRWLEAGRVPALAPYFAGAPESTPAAGSATKDDRADGPTVTRAAPVFPETAAASPVQAVSASMIVTSFAVVLIFSVAAAFLWVYYRDWAERAERAAGGPKIESIKALEAEHERVKKILVRRNRVNESALQNRPQSAHVGLMTVDQEICTETGSSYVDVDCAQQVREQFSEMGDKAKKQHEQLREMWTQKRVEIAAQMEELNRNTDAERKRLADEFYGAAAKNRFYYAFLPLFLGLGTLNGARIFLKKKIAEPLRQ